MRFTGLALLFMSSAALAAPAPVQGDSLEARDIAASCKECGVCNGTSCKIGILNHPCYKGGCVGTGGGDGAACGGDDWEHLICPVGS